MAYQPQEPHIVYTTAGHRQMAAVGGAGLGDPSRPLAVQAAEQVWADPAAQEMLKQQAVVVGGHVAEAAKYYGKQGVAAFQDYIQQGPQGISTLCFVGGSATSALGGLGIFNLGAVVDPFHYILSFYMFVFGVATAIIEADPDRVGMMMTPFDRLAEPITRTQAWLYEECRLLTRLRGRGLFYLYQGTLMVTQCMLCLFLFAGLFNMLMGIICVMVSFGIKPDIEGMVTGVSSQQQYAAIGNDVEARGASVGLGAAQTADFGRAEAAWKQHKERLPGKVCRELWALHQQATIGDCSEQRPSGMFNGNAKEQWRLWSRIAGTPPDAAKAEFVEKLRSNGVPV